MSLADDVRKLELLRERGSLAESEFELRVAELLRSVTAAHEDTIVDSSGEPVGEHEVQGGPPPAHLGAYELKELLGKGGMGAVYLAKHLLKPGLVAIKVPRKDFLRRPGFGHHFKKEAGVGLKLDHPGIVRVLDLVIDGEWAAIVMQFVAGPNLETVLRNNGGPLPPARVVELMSQVLEAMDYAHRAGVLHRDLKPKNLLLHPSGRVQVTDFGVAGLIGMEDNQMGSMLGTAPYMAPELYTGAARIDQRTDIYALGMTLYKLLVGRLPFRRDMNPYQVLRAKEQGRVPLPAELGVGVPDHLVEVIFRALRPNPIDRFGSCADFRAALIAGPRTGAASIGIVSSGSLTAISSPSMQLGPAEGSALTPTPHLAPPAATAIVPRDLITSPTMPSLESQTRMSAGTLMSLLLVTALLAAVLALALAGDFDKMLASRGNPGSGSAPSGQSLVADPATGGTSRRAEAGSGVEETRSSGNDSAPSEGGDVLRPVASDDAKSGEVGRPGARVRPGQSTNARSKSPASSTLLKDSPPSRSSSSQRSRTRSTSERNRNSPPPVTSGKSGTSPPTGSSKPSALAGEFSEQEAQEAGTPRQPSPRRSKLSGSTQGSRGDSPSPEESGAVSSSAAEPLPNRGIDGSSSTGVSSEETRNVGGEQRDQVGPPMGFLYLSALPDCTVSIDGKNYGSTAKTRRGLVLPEGSYKVRFVCEQEQLCAGFEKRAGVKTLRVYGDRATRYEANFYRLNDEKHDD